jgi:hypothetical protein
MDRSTRHLSANLGRDLLVILAYTAVSVALTYPLVRVFTTHVPGGGDVWQHLWNWWWLKKSLLELRTSPFFTPYLFHPDGTKLAYHSLSVLYKLVGMPLHLTCGIIVSYNLFFLLSYVLGGYGAYRLGLYVTRDRRAAFLSGLLFAFCSFHVYNHSLQVNNFEWLPFAGGPWMKERSDMDCLPVSALLLHRCVHGISPFFSSSSCCSPWSYGQPSITKR